MANLVLWLARVLALVSFCLAGMIPGAFAEFTVTGDVSPSNPSSWTGLTSTGLDGTIAYIGKTSCGALAVTEGNDLISQFAYIGYNANVTGAVTIDGYGSTWSSNLGMQIGDSGIGTLDIRNGGYVYGLGIIGANAGSTGTVTVQGEGSEWDADTVYVGQSGRGTLMICSGGYVNAGFGFIGSGSSSSGTVTVEGSGSRWGVFSLNVAHGTLNIEGGGFVHNALGYIGSNSGGNGRVVVDAAAWTQDGPLEAGCRYTWQNGQSVLVNGGVGTVSISNGGHVTTKSHVAIGGSSRLTIDVGRGSSLDVIESGTVTNNGTIRVVAGAGVETTTTPFLPISAETWSDGGTYQALGGTWNTTSHQFTVSAVQETALDGSTTIHLDAIQRVLATDEATGKSAGASFLAATDPTSVSFTAALIATDALTALERDHLNAETSILSGWEFSSGDYTVDANHPVYLSLEIGSGYAGKDFSVWHYDGANWTPYAADDLTYDGTYASFTATSFSGYAVTVPEPSTLAMLAAGLTGLLARVRRRRN